MRKDLTVSADVRTTRGKNEARRLRVAGNVPAIVYGGTEQPEAVAVNPKEVSKILNSRTGHNTIFNLTIPGREQTPVMIVDWQNEPIKDTLLHVDLKRIDLTARMFVKVPVITHGDPKGVKIQGGLHEVVTREVEIECLPDEIPEQFDIDVSELALGESIRASDIPLTGSLKLISMPEAVISHVISIRVEEEPAVEGATPAAEPEVTKKGKKEEGGAEAPAKKK